MDSKPKVLEPVKPLRKSVPICCFLRENGCYTNSSGPPKHLQWAAEDKLVAKNHEEFTCKLPDITKSTFLMVFSPDGKKIASTHGNHNVYVTDLTNGKNVMTLTGHPRTPWCIAFHPSSNQILASGCLGGQVRVWDLHGGSEIWTAESQTIIASLAFHPIERILVIASYNEIHFWDWSKRKPFAKCSTANEKEKVRYVAFDQLGKKLITGVANAPRVTSQWDRVSAPQPPPQGPQTEHERRITICYRYMVEQYEQLVERYFDLSRRSSITPLASTTTDRGTDPMEGNERAGSSANRGRQSAGTDEISASHSSTSFLNTVFNTSTGSARTSARPSPINPSSARLWERLNFLREQVESGRRILATARSATAAMTSARMSPSHVEDANFLIDTVWPERRNVELPPNSNIRRNRLSGQSTPVRGSGRSGYRYFSSYPRLPSARDIHTNARFADLIVSLSNQNRESSSSEEEQAHQNFSEAFSHLCRTNRHFREIMFPFSEPPADCLPRPTPNNNSDGGTPQQETSSETTSSEPSSQTSSERSSRVTNSEQQTPQRERYSINNTTIPFRGIRSFLQAFCEETGQSIGYTAIPSSQTRQSGYEEISPPRRESPSSLENSPTPERGQQDDVFPPPPPMPSPLSSSANVNSSPPPKTRRLHLSLDRNQNSNTFLRDFRRSGPPGQGSYRRVNAGRMSRLGTRNRNQGSSRNRVLNPPVLSDPLTSSNSDSTDSPNSALPVDSPSGQQTAQSNSSIEADSNTNPPISTNDSQNNTSTSNSGEPENSVPSSGQPPGNPNTASKSSTVYNISDFPALEAFVRQAANSESSEAGTFGGIGNENPSNALKNVHVTFSPNINGFSSFDDSRATTRNIDEVLLIEPQGSFSDLLTESSGVGPAQSEDLLKTPNAEASRSGRISSPFFQGRGASHSSGESQLADRPLDDTLEDPPESPIENTGDRNIDNPEPSNMSETATRVKTGAVPKRPPQPRTSVIPTPGSVTTDSGLPSVFILPPSPPSSPSSSQSTPPERRGIHLFIKCDLDPTVYIRNRPGEGTPGSYRLVNPDGVIHIFGRKQVFPRNLNQPRPAFSHTSTHICRPTPPNFVNRGPTMRPNIITRPALRPQTILPKLEIQEPIVDRSEIIDYESNVDRPEIEPPSIDRLEIRPPNIDRPEIRPPSIDRPEIETYVSNVDRSEIRPPSIDRPEIETYVSNVDRSEIRPPSINISEVRPPNINIPEIRPPSINGSEITPPSIDRLEIMPPSVDRLEITPPSIDRLEVRPPNIGRLEMGLSDIDRPEFRPSNIDRLEIRPPNIGILEMGLPNIDRPEISPPNIDRPEIRPPSIDRLEITPPSIDRLEIRPSNIGRPEMRPFNIDGPKIKLPKISLCEVRRTNIERTEERHNIIRPEIRRCNIERLETRQNISRSVMRRRYLERLEMRDHFDRAEMRRTFNNMQVTSNTDRPDNTQTNVNREPIRPISPVQESVRRRLNNSGAIYDRLMRDFMATVCPRSGNSCPERLTNSSQGDAFLQRNLNLTSDSEINGTQGSGISQNANSEKNNVLNSGNNVEKLLSVDTSNSGNNLDILDSNISNSVNVVETPESNISNSGSAVENSESNISNSGNNVENPENNILNSGCNSESSISNITSNPSTNTDNSENNGGSSSENNKVESRKNKRKSKSEQNKTVGSANSANGSESNVNNNKGKKNGGKKLGRSGKSGRRSGNLGSSRHGNVGNVGPGNNNDRTGSGKKRKNGRSRLSTRDSTESSAFSRPHSPSHSPDLIPESVRMSVLDTFTIARLRSHLWRLQHAYQSGEGEPAFLSVAAEDAERRLMSRLRNLISRPTSNELPISSDSAFQPTPSTSSAGSSSSTDLRSIRCGIQFLSTHIDNMSKLCRGLVPSINSLVQTRIQVDSGQVQQIRRMWEDLQSQIVALQGAVRGEVTVRPRGTSGETSGLEGTSSGEPDDPPTGEPEDTPQEAPTTEATQSVRSEDIGAEDALEDTLEDTTDRLNEETPRRPFATSVVGRPFGPLTAPTLEFRTRHPLLNEEIPIRLRVPTIGTTIDRIPRSALSNERDPFENNPYIRRFRFLQRSPRTSSAKRARYESNIRAADRLNRLHRIGNRAQTSTEGTSGQSTATDEGSDEGRDESQRMTTGERGAPRRKMPNPTSLRPPSEVARVNRLLMHPGVGRARISNARLNRYRLNLSGPRVLQRVPARSQQNTRDFSSQTPPSSQESGSTNNNSTESQNSQRECLSRRARNVLLLMVDSLTQFFENDSFSRSGTADSLYERISNLYSLLQIALKLTALLLSQMESVRFQRVGSRRLLRRVVPEIPPPERPAPPGRRIGSSHFPVLVRSQGVPILMVNDGPVPAENPPPLPRDPADRNPPHSQQSQHFFHHFRPRLLAPRYVAHNPLDDSAEGSSSIENENIFFMRGTGAASMVLTDTPMAPHHRIQSWDFSNHRLPEIHNAEKNVVVYECKIQNDASVDISTDGKLLVTLLPSGRVSATTMLGIYSLDWDTLGQCLYTTSFDQSAVSVSLSPTMNHLIVGLASRRIHLFNIDRHTIAQIFRLEGGKPKKKSELASRGRLVLVRDLELDREHEFMSLNCIRWIPMPGAGFVYGTNTGQLKILR